MTREELACQLQSGEELLLVMTLGELDYQIKHIPGSIRANSPQELLECRTTSRSWCMALKEAARGPSRHTGSSSATATATSAATPEGSLEWEQAGLPLAAGVPEPR
jgi:hypothetical protein